MSTASSIRIDPSYQGVMNQTPCADWKGIQQKQAEGWRDVFKRISTISSQDVQSRVYVHLVQREPYILLTHSVAMEKLQGKNKAEALASIAFSKIADKQWNELPALLREIRETGEGSVEYQKEIAESLYDANQTVLASQIVIECLEHTPGTKDSWALFAQEQTKAGKVTAAKVVRKILMDKDPAFHETPSGKNLATSIDAAEDEILNVLIHGQIQASAKKGKYGIFLEVKKKIEDAYAAKGISSIKIEIGGSYGDYGCYRSAESVFGPHVLEALKKAVDMLIKDRMLDKVCDVVNAILDLDGEATKLSLVAEIAITLLSFDQAQEYVERIITHNRQEENRQEENRQEKNKQEKTVDAALVRQIATSLTKRFNDPIRGLFFANKYLQGSDLTQWYDEFAKLWFNQLASFWSSPLQHEIKEKGKLFVSLVNAQAQNDIQKARDLVGCAETFVIPEEDRIEALIYIAKAEIEKQEKLEDVLARLANSLSSDSERIKKAYTRLAELLLTNAMQWEQADEMINHLKEIVSREVLDRLLENLVTNQMQAYHL
jgi:hypothetical protein